MEQGRYGKIAYHEKHFKAVFLVILWYKPHMYMVREPEVDPITRFVAWRTRVVTSAKFGPPVRDLDIDSYGEL
jgi:hypothetical protein